jgi:hypothetical protein
MGNGQWLDFWTICDSDLLTQTDSPAEPRRLMT